MGYSQAFLMLALSWLFLIPVTLQLQSSQTYLLQQLRKHLEYPKQLEAWSNSGDLCYTPSSPALSIACKDNSITKLRIMGDKPVNVSNFEGFPSPGQTLSPGFSVDTFITTLSRLTTLRIVSLVSLGIWGSLPDKIHRLSSLEVLDLSSNFLYGSITPKVSVMAKLQTLTLDYNFFNDTVPDWFDSLSNLTVLSLKNNQLKGVIPTSISRTKTLTALALSHNRISGRLPDMSGLTSLQVLDLRENQLVSELPVMPKGLVTILLSRNSLSGEIPHQFGTLHQLQHVDFSFNFLSGTPPASLFTLPNISYVNLASNQLTGSLPRSLYCSRKLGFVDLSTNRLTGELSSCLSSRSDERVVKFSGNCLSGDPQHQHEESYCTELKAKKNGSPWKNAGFLVGVILGITVITLILGLALLRICRKYCSRGISEQQLLPKPELDTLRTGFSTELLTNARYISQAVKLGSAVYRAFSLEELKDSTNNFHQSTYMGNGSAGKLYKGKLENGNLVAIRRLVLFKRYSIRNLKLRLDLLSKFHHPHLVCLLGHCIDASQDGSTVTQVFLVYEYVPNGNLHTHISEYGPEKVLKWSERLRVLIGVAKAVHFLHTGIIPGFFNNRLKINNILLDEHCIAKLSDYGLSIITEEIDKYEARTEGHKSFIQGKASMWKKRELEDDVYSFGFILLETLVGTTISEREEASLLTELGTSLGSHDGRKRIVDPVVLSTSSQESLSIVISITNKCIASDSSSRPSIEDVLWNLQYAGQVQATADCDQRSEMFQT